MNEVIVKTKNGIGFWGLLQLVLITLKLCNVIDWSWWVVFFPLWVSLGISILIIIVMLIFWQLLKR